jgi:hypothetical protein
MPVDDEAVEIHKSLHHVLGIEGGGRKSESLRQKVLTSPL